MAQQEFKIDVPIPNSIAKISAILTAPSSHYFVNNNDSSIGKLCVILHGNGGHKNYCYHRALSNSLSNEGFWSVRFDFRGCGESTTNTQSRTIAQDVEDLTIVVDYFTKGTDFKSELLSSNFDIGDVRLCLDVIVSHSRGSLAMFNYCLREQKENALELRLVNCAGRFDGAYLEKRITRLHPDWIEEGGYSLDVGQGKSVWITSNEVNSLIEQHMGKLDELQRDIPVLSIYGSEDSIIPNQDKYEFDEVLGGKPRHELEIIKGADHNFHGVEMIERDEIVDGEICKDGITYAIHKRKNVIDYSQTVVSVIVKWLDETTSVDV